VETLQTTLLCEGLEFGEGPRWHDGRLWVSDIQAGRVYTVDDGHLQVAVETRGASGLGWLPDGRLVISTLGRPYVRRVERDGEVTTLHDLRDLGWSLNDMVVGPDGRIYADLYLEQATPLPGAIVLITPDGTVRPVASDLVTPNGLAITPDGSTLVASETGTGRVLAWDIDGDGSLQDRRVFAELGADRRPDGLCLDAEGAVWVGSYATSEFLRVLDGGEITHRIETPGRAAIAPALGGDDRRTLFLVVNDDMNPVMEGAVRRGHIETTRVDVPGAGWP
jgi:sugar lactone lactonase YvrE